MNQNIIQNVPKCYHSIEEETRVSGFTMASDLLTGSLLRTLALSKPSGSFLELGTGTGLSTSWILDGMNAEASLVSVDSDARFLNIASKYLGEDARLTLIESDGGEWLEQNSNHQFDYIFADTWHGKYLMLDETLSMLRKGGLYIIDDMLPQPNWPEGHALKAEKLIGDLDKRTDLLLTKMNWSTGMIVAVKK